MDKKIKKFAIAAGIVLVAIMIGIILILVQVHELRNTTGAVAVKGVDTQMEAPSILSDSDVDFAGKKSLSTEKGTIGVKVSATPLEFKEGTRARIKVDGKSYKLKRNDNSFTKILTVSAFKSMGPMEIIFEDGETVRSEFLDSEGLRAFLPVDFSWGFDATVPEFGKDKIVFDNKMILTSSEEGDPMFSSAQVCGEIDGKQVYEKSFELAGMGADSLDMAFDWKAEIKVPEGKTLDIYLVTKDEYGFVYQYKFGQISKKDQGETFGNQDYQKLEVLNSKGKAVFSQKIKNLFEEDTEE